MKKRGKAMKSRETLIRLQKWHVDEVRRKLADLESTRAEFEKRKADLEASVADERRFGETSPIGVYAYPSFARAMNDRRRKLEESIQGIEKEILTTKDALTDAFGELKKAELLEEQRAERERTEGNRREQSDLDDIALKTYRRRQVQGQA
jgi:flagellar export protein FliJ